MNRIRRIRKIMIRVAIGAAIGGSVASLVAIIIVREPSFFADTLKVLGTGGFIGGAILGAMIGAFSKSGEKVGVVIGGVIGGIGGCILMMIATCLYVAIPWPSPQPYPGVEAHAHVLGGAGGGGSSRTYTVTLSLDDMQYYYERQMNRYCESAWRFEELSDYEEYPPCRQAHCEIRRLWLYQYFEVSLCSVSETQTVVTHVDWAED